MRVPPQVPIALPFASRTSNAACKKKDNLFYTGEMKKSITIKGTSPSVARIPPTILGSAIVRVELVP